MGLRSGFEQREFPVKKLAVGVVFVLAASACSDSSSTTIFTAPPTSATTTTTTSPTPTTAAPSTTTTTTTTPAPTTTAVATTTTAAPTTTTTVAAPVFSFDPDGLGFAQFGAAPAIVINTLTEMFGPPFRDTGWIDEPICPGPMNRFVDFGVELFDFQVMFTTGDLFAPAGTEHFYSYRYNGATAVPVNPPDLTVGTTNAQLQTLFPIVEYSPNPFIEGQLDYHVPGPGFQGIFGGVSGGGLGDVVLSVQGGIGCGE